MTIPPQLEIEIARLELLQYPYRLKTGTTIPQAKATRFLPLEPCEWDEAINPVYAIMMDIRLRGETLPALYRWRLTDDQFYITTNLTDNNCPNLVTKASELSDDLFALIDEAIVL